VKTIFQNFITGSSSQRIAQPTSFSHPKVKGIAMSEASGRGDQIVNGLIQRGRQLAKSGHYAQAEACLEQALMRQVELNGGNEDMNCFDLLCDLCHVYGLRGREGRKALFYQRAIAILLNCMGEKDRRQRLQAAPFNWMA
jgi:hypothetical protein